MAVRGRDWLNNHRWFGKPQSQPLWTVVSPCLFGCLTNREFKKSWTVVVLTDKKISRDKQTDFTVFWIRLQPVGERSSHATHQGTLVRSRLSSLSHCGLIQAWSVEVVRASWSPLGIIRQTLRQILVSETTNQTCRTFRRILPSETTNQTCRTFRRILPSETTNQTCRTFRRILPYETTNQTSVPTKTEYRKNVKGIFYDTLFFFF